MLCFDTLQGSKETYLSLHIPVRQPARPRAPAGTRSTARHQSSLLSLLLLFPCRRHLLPSRRTAGLSCRFPQAGTRPHSTAF